MAALPHPPSATVRAIYAHYERRRDAEPARGYLGASIIGHACDRYLWLQFRWAGAEAFDGRMLRLFDRGHRAEARFVDELRAIGAEVHEVGPDGKQFGVVACDGHFKGHMDGAARGVPEAPKAWHVLEFKTHSAKSFKALQAEGVAESKPQHWAQVQVYMLLTGMNRALYLAENKDTDELYSERIQLDETAAQGFIDRAQRLINASEPPLRLSEDPAWYVCRWCPHHALCHGTEVPQVGCRTCAYATPASAGRWECARRGITSIPLNTQRTGCDEHRYIPPLLERIGRPVNADTQANAVTYETPEGSQFTNGAPPAGFTSAEIRACKDKASLAGLSQMEDVQQWRAQFNATVVG